MKVIHLSKALVIACIINLLVTISSNATVFTVDNPAGTDDFAAASAGTMTFLKCIRLASADATGGATGHRIYFNIAPAGQKLLSVTNWQQLNNTNLNNLIIDGSTQPFAGTGPHIIFVSGGISEGIQISGLTNVTLTGLGFRDFQISIKMDNAISCTISNCFLGTDNTGTTPLCTNCTDAAIKMNNGCRFNTIGGSAAGTRNVIYKHRNGVYMTGATNSDNTVGCTAAGEPNIISGHIENGVYIQNTSTNNKVAGNIIGLDITGTVASATYSNMYKGILVQGSQSTIIGGATAGERNIVSGNGYGTGNDGIFLETNCHNSQITNCYIGVDVSGNTPLKNLIRGILILNCNNVQVTSNIVAAHDEIGIYVQTSSGTVIKSNYVGLNASGNGNTATLGNQIGINMENCTGSIIGGPTPAEANYISGNREHGIRLDRGSTAQISGNKIGLTPSGASMGNLGYGIYLHNSDNNTIGGATTAHGNEIANNISSGVGLSNAYWTGDGSPDASGADNNFIYRNIIHHNGADGIRLYKVGAAASVKNWFSQNSIYCNTGIGINLSLSNGNNANKAAPVLTSVNVGTNTVNGTAGAGDLIEVFVDPNCPTCQSKEYLGSTTADGSGNWSYTNAVITSANNLSATATEGSGTNRNTSQLAACISVLPVDFISFTGKRMEDNYIVLSWNTANEINNEYFNIERSYDGINFEWIGKVEGNGTGTSVFSYSFDDRQVSTGTVYYRLEQVDFDGQRKFSEIINIKGIRQESLTLFPNPAENELNIALHAEAGELTISLVSVSGQEISTEHHIHNGGLFFHKLQFDTLAKGLYFLKIGTVSDTFEMKVIKK